MSRPRPGEQGWALKFRRALELDGFARMPCDVYSTASVHQLCHKAIRSRD